MAYRRPVMLPEGELRSGCDMQ